MAYECKIIADSLAPNGRRLTTFQVTFPRIILAEINTHRAFSRNSASSRAIPVEKMIAKVQEDPFIPIYWGKNQKGMQAGEELTELVQRCCMDSWLIARDHAVIAAGLLLHHGVHKQITNRLLEPFLWHTAIISATDYANFFAQRCHPDAQPEIRRIAEMMRDAYDAGEPDEAIEGDPHYWHLPYASGTLDGRYLGNYGSPYHGGIEIAKKVSVARCARVSYLTQDGEYSIEADLALYDRLVQGSHWSPFEHIAQPGSEAEPMLRSGNFRGWTQFRKQFKDKNRTEYPHAE